jgi:hypothetical protein
MGTTAAPPAQSIQVVGPHLHHRLPFCHASCAAIGTSNFVTLRVRELQLDHIARVTHFV